jgi:hypothetical protein
MRVLIAFAVFWYGFIIGDDWKIAVAVLAPLLVGAVAVLTGVGGAMPLAPLLAVGFGVAFSAAVLVDARNRRVPR